MPAFPREEMEEMVRRWVAANNESGRTGDWSRMSAFYTEDAIYSWNTGPNWEFVARGRKQIHEWAFGTEMAGLEDRVALLIRDAILARLGETSAQERSAA